ncbi:MAG: NAD(P)-binding protein [Bacilli bacterium]
MKIAIIGAGVSGLSIARILNSTHEIKVFERDSQVGGLIKCSIEQGNLYHHIGGHVFNSRRQDVLDWFWNIFDQKRDFIPARRNVAISLEDGKVIGAPIENHIYQLDESTQSLILEELLESNTTTLIDNFDDFLRSRFGETLYRIYFGPYNHKIWGKSLKDIPLSSMEGKLPSPSIKEILLSNIRRNGEGSNFVHSSFYYPQKGGSQFIADTLSKGLNIVCNAEITNITRMNHQWIIKEEAFDKIIFTANIKDLPTLLNGSGLLLNQEEIASLEYHGTTSVLCYIDSTPYSWIYMPSQQHESHRIICTGNFSTSNNAQGTHSVTIEFSKFISKDDILDNLSKIPFHPQYITHHYEEFTYPIQNKRTIQIIQSAKNTLEPQGIYLVGRFAEWEYYNMDAAIGASMDIVARLKL